MSEETAKLNINKINELRLILTKRSAHELETMKNLIVEILAARGLS